MQPAPIANATPVNTTNNASAAPPSPPYDSQPSPFTTVFHAVLKSAGSNNKISSPGKAQDSGRASAGNAKPGNSSRTVLSSGAAMIPPTASPATAAGSGPTIIDPFLSLVPVQGATSAASPNSDLQIGLDAPANLFRSGTSTDADHEPATSTPALQTAAGTTDSTVPGTAENLDGNKNALLPNTRQENLTAAMQSFVSPFDLQANANPSANAIQDSGRAQSGAPGTEQKTALDPAISSNKVVSDAPDQNIPLTIPNPVPSKLIPQTFASLSDQNGSTADPSGALPTVAVESTRQDLKSGQAIRTDLKLLSLQDQPGAAAAAASKTSVTPLAQLPSNHDALLNSLASTNTSPGLAETLEHSAAKSAVASATTLKFHENMKTQPESQAPSVPVAAGSAKAQSQESSNGSSTGDSNAAPDHGSNAASGRPDEKGFVQTFDAAATNSSSGHAATPDPASVAAAMPAQAQPPNSNALLSQASAAGTHQTEILPASSEGTAVVNSAHMLAQSGQTEIRIEMQADSLGGVELRAHIAGDQIGASIAVEHHDAQVALTTDLPALHNALAEKNLRLETLTVTQGSFSSLGGGLGHDAGQRGFSHPQSHAKFAFVETPEAPQLYRETTVEWTGTISSGSGLSVVA
jgi:flagellar hook-length control protein FliK